MQKRIERNEFLEYATVHGNLYGTSYQSIQDVIASNRSCILDIDIQGVQSVMKKQAEGTYILIVPHPSRSCAGVCMLETRIRKSPSSCGCTTASRSSGSPPRSPFPTPS